MWPLQGSSTCFITWRKAGTEGAGVGEEEGGVPRAETTLGGKALVWRVLVEAIRTNTPAANWGTSLERPGSWPDLSPMEKGQVSSPCGQLGASASQLEHKTRGATADRNPTGDEQY